MNRVGHLFERIVDFENLLDAFHKAQRGKQDRVAVMAFRSSLHANLGRMRDELESGSFHFGDYRQFTVRDPKTRLIQAAPFEQRVAHHAIVNVVGPVFERRFIHDSYACRRNKGQHSALQRAEMFVQRHPFFLKMDIRKFYDSIDHAVLAGMLVRQIKDRRVLELLEDVIASYCTNSGTGLPIGNLTSQWFGNVYLDPFDHWIKEVQGCRCYLRYMDDMLCFGTKDAVLGWRDAAVDWLVKDLKLLVNHEGEINRAEKGVPFLGHVLQPHATRLSQRSEHRFRRKFRTLEKMASDGRVSEPELAERGLSLFAAAGYGSTEELRRHLANTSRFRDV